MRRRTLTGRGRPSWGRLPAALGVLVLAGALSSCGSGFATPSGTSGRLSSGSGPLRVLIGSSGDAETRAVRSAVAAWSRRSGTRASVENASDLDQQLSQGFASGRPPDVFYVSTASFAGYATNGSLLAYGSRLADADDFYPTLRRAFTRSGRLYCAPKDFSTLALYLNEVDWRAAGLTDADVPTTWAQLAAVAKRLTASGHVGLSFSPQYERIGAFMAQAGGSLTNPAQTRATVDSAANRRALAYVKSLLASGSTKLSSDLGEGWGGDAFGKGKAAMTIEGNWLTGTMSATYPHVRYRVVPLPAGPSGRATLQFTNCWGIAAASEDQKAALALVEHLTSAPQQLAFARAFGVMPSVRSAAARWKREFPADAAFLAQAGDARAVPDAPGTSDVIADLDAKISTLRSTSTDALLAQEQKNMAAAVGGSR